MPGNNKSSGASGTRRLVAPELLPGLEVFPSFDFNDKVLRAVRAGTGVEPQKQACMRLRRDALDRALAVGKLPG